MFNEVFEERLPLEVATGLLIALQNSSKLLGPLKSLKPTVLLTTLRKTLSLVTLHRISKMNEFLLPIQANLDADGQNQMWDIGDLPRYTKGYMYVIEIQCIDLTSAPGSVAFVPRHRQRPNLLLPETKITIRVDDALSVPFNSTVSTPQGTRCRRYSSLCASVQPFGRCADAFRADRQSTTTYPVRQ